MPRHPSRYKARHNDASHFSRSMPTDDSPLDERLEYAGQRTSREPQADLTTLSAPEITPLNILLTTPVASPHWIIPNLLPSGISLLTGKSGTGKSWLAFRLAMAVATCTPVQGHMPSSQGSVLYLGLEENRSHTLDRASRLLHGQPAPAALEWAEHWHPLTAGGLADIEDWLDAHDNARLVVVDSLNNVYPRQRNHQRHTSNRDREHAIMFPLKVLAAMHHVSILIIHHLRYPDSVDLPDEAALAANLPNSSLTDCTLFLKRAPTTQETTLHITGPLIPELTLKVL